MNALDSIIGRPSAIAIDAKWLERFARRYLGWHREFPHSIARSNRRVALKCAAINFSHFRDHGGPSETPCDRDGSDGRVLALKEREFRRWATPATILDLLEEIDALHAAVFDLDPRFCWEPQWRKFVNKLRRHPETADPHDEECERDESEQTDASEAVAARSIDATQP